MLASEAGSWPEGFVPQCSQENLWNLAEAGPGSLGLSY